MNSFVCVCVFVYHLYRHHSHPTEKTSSTSLPPKHTAPGFLQQTLHPFNSKPPGRAREGRSRSRIFSPGRAEPVAVFLLQRGFVERCAFWDLIPVYKKQKTSKI